MSIERGDTSEGARRAPGHLVGRRAEDDVNADRRIIAAIEDFFVPENARLDDRLRAGVDHVLTGIIGLVEHELCDHAGRIVAQAGVTELVKAMTEAAPAAYARLARTGLLRDADLMREVIARVRQDVIAEALPDPAPANPSRPSLIARLINDADRAVTAPAMAVAAGDSRRRAVGADAPMSRTELPVALQRRLVWLITATLSQRFGVAASGERALLDQALTDAALRSLESYDDDDRLEPAAMRLASAMDAQENELPGLLVEALGDRRVALFIALIAHALGIDYDLARDIVFDAVTDRLWFVLRALGVDSDTIARIGLTLSEADSRRDIDAFAERIDMIMAVTPEAALSATARLRLHPDLRHAMLALARSARR